MNVRVDLFRRSQRPLFNVTVGGVLQVAMLDTGAEIPVFIGDCDLIETLGGRLAERNVWFLGFGGRCMGDMYRVDLDLGGFLYRDLPVLQTEGDDSPYRSILSATMFSGYSYLIDDRHKVLTVNTYDDTSSRHIRIIDKDGHVRVLADTRPTADEGA